MNSETLTGKSLDKYLNKFTFVMFENAENCCGLISFLPCLIKAIKLMTLISNIG